MFVEAGKIQFAVIHLTDKSLKEAQLLFKHVNPLVVKKAFELANLNMSTNSRIGCCNSFFLQLVNIQAHSWFTTAQGVTQSFLCWTTFQ